MKENSKKSIKIVPIILAVVILIGAVVGIREYLYLQNHIDTDDAQVDGDISPVVSRVGGYVDTILFEDNQHVVKGQVLVKLDQHDYQIKLEQAIAAQRGASAGIDVSKSQINTTSASSATAKSNAVSAKVRLWRANQDYTRYANLVKEGAVTQQQFDSAKAEKEAAEAAYQAAQAQYRAAEGQVGTTRSQLQVTNTGVDQRQADVDFAKLQLSYTTIKAPASGIISKKSIQTGQLIQAGQTLFSVVNDNSIYITANFKETQMEDLKSGSNVEVEVDAYPDHIIKGQVYNFSPATGAKFSLLPPDNATGNFVKVVQRIPVKIKIKTEEAFMKRLRPGMSVKVSVHTDDK
ncbi:Membrane fusion component of tripartite multidrug resistance system [Arcticibacter svalbardensis MN12-7]|uniref:Membrane fusion component of tripartite multidrug resistance system n=1 Tax=Arcticibacter svalbardensis MN12-7 TaxID=1150600 RepID=R9GR75_9SPHI|nr:HlyD family secretion protein [Arcticibacter svalbardensis]EOR94050.1 Membrane fusion component of tripartite multidrug resistance system [Arcticibacter svalbardensis MN12-7]